MTRGVNHDDGTCGECGQSKLIRRPGTHGRFAGDPDLQRCDANLVDGLAGDVYSHGSSPHFGQGLIPYRNMVRVAAEEQAKILWWDVSRALADRADTLARDARFIYRATQKIWAPYWIGGPNGGHLEHFRLRKVYTASVDVPLGFLPAEVHRERRSDDLRHYLRPCHAEMQPAEIMPLVLCIPPGGRHHDMYLGNGAVAVACLDSGRRVFGGDIDRKAVRAVRRACHESLRRRKEAMPIWSSLEGVTV